MLKLSMQLSRPRLDLLGQGHESQGQGHKIWLRGQWPILEDFTSLDTHIFARYVVDTDLRCAWERQ